MQGPVGLAWQNLIAIAPAQAGARLDRPAAAALPVLLVPVSLAQPLREPHCS